MRNARHEGSTMATSKRTVISPRGDKRFVRRDAKGRITESDDAGRSLAQDRRRQAKTVVASGQGDKGDRKPAAKRAATRAGTARKASTKRATAAATRTPRARPATKSSTPRRAAATSAAAPNAIQLLKADHATVRDMLAKLEKTTSRGAATRMELLARIRREVEVHTTIEEEIFYPAFRAAGARQDDDKLYFEALEEHRAAGELVLPDLLATDPSSECFGGRAKVLKELIEHHAREEEREMFPRARELLTAAELKSLGERMQARKTALLAQPAQPAPPKSLAGRVMSAVVDALSPERTSPPSTDGDADAPAPALVRQSPADGAASPEVTNR
jgi:hemerythrin superfamily protein